jgi:hypothetical protein
MKKLLFPIIPLAVVLAGGFLILNAHIYAQKQRPNEAARYRGSLSGTVVCLPHKGDGPHTKECAIGLKTDAGEHYALDFMLMSQTMDPVQTGDRLSANGVIIPVEMLKDDSRTKYDIAGLFSVTDVPENTGSPGNR